MILGDLGGMEEKEVGLVEKGGHTEHMTFH